jgi:voltage-gated potassium channel
VNRSEERSALRLARRSALALLGVVAIGVIGYSILGFGLLDASYQTLTTITTIGFREVVPFGTAEKLFTMAFVLVGVGVGLYALTMLLGAAVEGHLGSAWERRRMTRTIENLSGHAIICGWGRVGRAAAHELSKQGSAVVLVDADPERLTDCPYPFVVGDASRDEVLRQAGIEQAATLVASLDIDANSLYVTLSARALNPDLKIIARARTDDAEEKFLRAGADRVVNPQRIGGNRVAAFALQPHVVDFLDVAMHDEEVEFRLEEVRVAAGSPLVGRSVRQTRESEGEGALLLALRPAGTHTFVTNPAGSTQINADDLIIAIGTADQLAVLQHSAQPG